MSRARLVQFNADGHVSIDGVAIPNSRVTFTKEALDIGQLIIETPVIDSGELIEGKFEVGIIVDMTTGGDPAWFGRGPTRAAALRHLADKLEGQP